MIVNISFNIREEPIVCSPKDAIRCFMGTQLDLLVMENYLIYKREQNSDLFEDCKNKYKLD